MVYLLSNMGMQVTGLQGIYPLYVDFSPNASFPCLNDFSTFGSTIKACSMSR